MAAAASVAGGLLLAQPAAHLIELCTEALALNGRQIGRGQRELELLIGQRQITAGQSVLRHVVVGVPGISGRARRERG